VATGPVNLIAMSAGTITREWPASAINQDANGANALAFGGTWHSKSGTSGPYVFVFELARPAEIDSVGFRPFSDANDAAGPTHAAQAARVESSTEGPDAGYRTLGDFALKPTIDEQHFVLKSPVTARWLRVTVQQRTADFTMLSSFFAFGMLQPPPTPHSISGVWLYDESAGKDSDKVFLAPGRLAAVPDPLLVVSWRDRGHLEEGYQVLHVVQQGADFRAGRCRVVRRRDSTAANAVDDDPIGSMRARELTKGYAGSQTGALVTFTDHPLADGVVNAEGNLIVGATPPHDADPYILMRLAPGPDCAHVAPPAGSGQNVLVLTAEGSFDHYPPANEGTAGYTSYADKVAHFPGYRFTSLSIAVFTPEALRGVDIVVLGYMCDLGKFIAPWQAQALLDFTKTGHKLIIHDADKCEIIPVMGGNESPKIDYSFLPYPFATSNPGAQGASGDNLIIVEPNTLGTDTKDAPQFLDVKAYLGGNNQVGDANTVTSHDPHWCGHLFGTNALNVDGFMHMYAPYDRGLIIYSGFDADDSVNPIYMKLLFLELQQPVPALLPCTESVAGKFLVAPSKMVPFVPGRAAQVQVPLQVLANQGWAGAVSLTTKAPADAPWKTALSVPQVTLKGNTAPVTFTLDVPATATAGGHDFLVIGTDGQGDSAAATITLVAAPAAAVAAVETVSKGCTKQLTVGSDALFAFNQATLTATAQQALGALGPAIKQSGQHPVQINGYTDSIGSDRYNQVLSEQRAGSVRTWLAKHGYVPASTPIQGLGKRDPVAPNQNPDGTDNPAGRAKNRRVEVLIDTCK